MGSAADSPVRRDQAAIGDAGGRKWWIPAAAGLSMDGVLITLWGKEKTPRPEATWE